MLVRGTLASPYIGGGGRLRLPTLVEGVRGTLASPYIICLNGKDLDPADDMFNGFSIGTGKWLISLR